MTWWIRMIMGLPPRAEDLEQMEQDVPEVFDGTRRPAFPAIYDSGLWRDAREWVERAYPEELGRYRNRGRDRRGQIPLRLECAHPDCPLKQYLSRGNRNRVTTHAPEAPGAASEDISVVRMDLMAAGGGSKPPLNAFLDMTRRVHAGKGIVKRLVVTDGYIFLSSSEQGTPGGIGNFIKYLSVLELPKGGNLELLVPPDARGKGKEAERIWSREISQFGRDREVAITKKYFKAGRHFHDRFYISQHEKGEISALFGPSLNGLSDRDFVLFGELERDALDRLKSYLL